MFQIAKAYFVLMLVLEIKEKRHTVFARDRKDSGGPVDEPLNVVWWIANEDLAAVDAPEGFSQL